MVFARFDYVFPLVLLRLQRQYLVASISLLSLTWLPWRVEAHIVAGLLAHQTLKLERISVVRFPVVGRGARPIIQPRVVAQAVLVDFCIVPQEGSFVLGLEARLIDGRIGLLHL